MVTYPTDKCYISPCESCAALRARVEELEEEWRIQAETAVKRLGRIQQLEEAVKWTIRYLEKDVFDQWAADELKRRAGRE